MSLPSPGHAIRRNRAPDLLRCRSCQERHPSLDRRLHSADNIGKPGPNVANGLAFGSENFLSKCQTIAAWRSIRSRRREMPLTKVIWTVAMDQAGEARLLQHAQTARAQIVCIRTTNSRLGDAIGRFLQQNIKVYGWRWPAVKPTPTSTTHYYAADEAAFVAQQLIPAGLDGYIVDPESDAAGAVNDWNDTSHAPLARAFCKTIKDAAPAGFHFGITSGCVYPRLDNRPHIPWAEFVAASDALYPQTYWRMRDQHGQIKDINGGSPDSAIDRGLDAWGRIAAHKPIVAMAGELELVTADELAAYGIRTLHEGMAEAHFYADSGEVPAGNLTAIAYIGAPIG